MKFIQGLLALSLLISATHIDAKSARRKKEKQTPVVVQKESENIYEVCRSHMIKPAKRSPEIFIQEEKAQTELIKKGQFALIKRQYDEYTINHTVISLFAGLPHHVPYGVMAHHCIKDFSLLGESSESASVVKVLSKNIPTSYGKMFATGMLLNPTVDIKELQRRQDIIQECVKNDALRTQVLDAARAIQKTENNFVSFFEKQTPLQEQVIENYFWMQKIPGLRTCATSPAFHGALQFIGRAWAWVSGGYFAYVIGKDLHRFTELEAMRAEIAAVTGEVWDTTTLRNINLFALAIDGGLGAWVFYSVYQMEKSNAEITCYLHEQLNDIALMLRSIQKINAVLEKDVEVTGKLQHYNDLKAVCIKKNKKISKDLRWMIKMLSNYTFKFKPTYISLKGRVLAAYKMMQQIKKEFAPCLHAFAEIETYCGVAQLYKDHENTELPYTFVEYLEDAQNPALVVNGMWNPLINTATTSAHKVVKNSLELGAQEESVQNVIITGPNAGGKSTFMKGVGVDVVLAQTFGIAAATSMVMTPFASINSYMNIVDDLEKGESLFKAEVKRAHALFEKITELKDGKFSFAVVDEMFSGTSPKEGEAATYSIAKKIGTCDHSIMLLATHFSKLKSLASETGNFKNCQVRVIRNADGTITYPFKLEDGFATQNVAFDILKQEGFSSSILDDAQQILDADALATPVSVQASVQEEPVAA